jgi:Fe2+ transport system protein B
MDNQMKQYKLPKWEIKLLTTLNLKSSLIKELKPIILPGAVSIAIDMMNAADIKIM